MCIRDRSGFDSNSCNLDSLIRSSCGSGTERTLTKVCEHGRFVGEELYLTMSHDPQIRMLLLAANPSDEEANRAASEQQALSLIHI